MVLRASGSPSTGAAALALESVNGCRRVPRPAARTRARMRSDREPLLGPLEHHVGAGEPELVAILEEESAVGIEDVVVRAPPERARHRRDPVFAAFDLD